MGCIPLLMKKKEDSTDKSILLKENEMKISNIDDLHITNGMIVKGSYSDPFEIYDYIKLLGEGSYGKVSKVINRKNGLIRALKAISKKKGEKINEEHRNKIVKEIEILKILDHPNIIKVYEYYETDTKLYIITEFCSGGELFEKILKVRNFNEKIVAHIMKQLLSAVNFCHINNVIHRDLKPENILIENQEEAKKEFFDIKIIDFGTSDIFKINRDKKDNKLTEKIGSLYYIAPEVLNCNYNEKCDIWSCGIIMYMLLCGSPPFYGENEKDTFSKILTSKPAYPEIIFNYISSEGKNLLENLLNKDMNKRFNGHEALNHPWFKLFFEENANNNNKIDINYKCLENIADNLRKFQTNQKLQQACVKYIVHNMLKKGEIEEYRKIFKKFDSNGDGRLSKEELIQGLTLTMSPLEAKIEVNRLIDHIDGDKSNFIEFEEFLSAFIDKEKILKEENLKDTFMLFDKDFSGKISTNEIKNILGKGSIVSDEVWKNIMNSIDENGDGEISFKEFKEMMEKMIK